MPEATFEFTRKNIDQFLRNKESQIALEEAQKAFDGVAEELGLKTEEDIQKIVDEMRGK